MAKTHRPTSCPRTSPIEEEVTLGHILFFKKTDICSDKSQRYQLQLPWVHLANAPLPTDPLQTSKKSNFVLVSGNSLRRRGVPDSKAVA